MNIFFQPKTKFLNNIKKMKETILKNPLKTLLIIAAGSIVILYGINHFINKNKKVTDSNDKSENKINDKPTKVEDNASQKEENNKETDQNDKSKNEQNETSTKVEDNASQKEEDKKETDQNDKSKNELNDKPTKVEDNESQEEKKAIDQNDKSEKTQIYSDSELFEKIQAAAGEFAFTPNKQLAYYKNLQGNANCLKNFPLEKIKNLIPILNILDKYIENKYIIVNNDNFKIVVNIIIGYIYFITLLSKKIVEDIIRGEEIKNNPELLEKMKEIFQNIIKNDFNAHTNVKNIAKFLKEKNIKICFINDEGVQDSNDLWNKIIHEILSFIDVINSYLECKIFEFAEENADPFRKALYDGFFSWHKL